MKYTTTDMMTVTVNFLNLFFHFAVWIRTEACKMSHVLCKCRNEWSKIRLSIIPLEKFNASMRLFASFFFPKDFEHIGWICHS